MSEKSMNAVRVHQFGGVDALIFEEVPCPVPGQGEVLVRVRAAGVGPWDSLIRRGRSELHQPLPLTLGSDLSGVVQAVGPNAPFEPGEKVFGATNPLFTGAYAEYAVADAGMIAPRPKGLSDIQAASVPVVACTAWQMLFDHGQVDAGKRALVQGASGNVGAYAVQLAVDAGAEVIGTAFPDAVDYVRSLGADRVIDVTQARFEDEITGVDVVLDTVGGDTVDRSFPVLKPGGVLVSVVSPPDPDKAARRGVRAVFFYVAVTTECLTQIAKRLETGQLTPAVGEVLALADARLAHEMLAGKPHKRGKIVLSVSED